MNDKPDKAYQVDAAVLPDAFPTHRHDPGFWEALGRTVATFGFLEETLGKAIFAITATTEYSGEAVADAVEKWTASLERALTDTLGAKISGYEAALKANPRVTLGNLDQLVDDLRKASQVRNAICHGSWGLPDEMGASVPHFVDRRFRRFDTKVDVAFLQQTGRHVTELAVAVINSVTTMGYQFPGSNGPGERIWDGS